MGIMQNYGTGAVSADGTQIVPDFDSAHAGHRYGISHFDWHFPECLPNAANPGMGGTKAGDPVDLASGLPVITKTDIVLGGARGQIGITRTFRGMTNNVGPFGIGAFHNYSYQLDTTNVASYLINLILPDGNQIPFVQSGGSSWGNITYSSFQGAVLTNVSCVFGTGCSATLRWKNGTTFQFQPFAQQLTTVSFLTSMTDSNGNKTTIVRNPNSTITQIIDPVGRTLNFTYDGNRPPRITSISDQIGRTVQYAYNVAGYLATVTDANSPAGVTTYAYDANNNLQTITDARGLTYLTNTSFDSNGRVLAQKTIDGGTTTFSYAVLNPLIVGCGVVFTCSSPSALTTVTDPNGNQTRYHFNPAGFLLDVTDALGRKTVYTTGPANLLLSVTDPLGRKTAYTYDSNGNPLTITRLAGTSNAVTTTVTYDPVFNKVTSITDPLGHTTTLGYDKAGNLNQVTDPIDPPASLVYDGSGELVSASDPLGNTSTLSYDGLGNLVLFKDPLLRPLSRLADAVGRTQSITNALGQTAQYQFSPLNQTTQITDPLNGQTSLTYDPNGNLKSLSDALGSTHTTNYTYDNMDRILTRTDALGHQECYGTLSGSTCQSGTGYDLNGNLIQYTDRRGKVTTFQYDKMNRRIFAGFGTTAGPAYESTISYSYDAADRLVQVTDSTSGTIAELTTIWIA
jgi:YD repeat-containing protein